MPEPRPVFDRESHAAFRAAFLLLVLFMTLVMFSAVVLAQDSATQSDSEAEGRTTLGESFKEGQFSLDLLYRYETVDQEGIDKEAHASTLRTAVGYKMKPFYGFAIGFLIEDVTSIGNDLYNNAGAGSLYNGVKDRPVVADPELTEFDQIYLEYSGLRDTRIKAGRSAYLLDNERFVGAIGWRQNHQSFDGAFFDSSAVGNWQFHYGYIERQHFVTGADWGMSTNLFNVRYDSPIGKVGGYGYLIDYDDDSRSKFSSATYGVRLDGSQSLDSFDLLYYGEYATQSDSGNNPNNYTVDYLHAVIGAKIKSFSVRLGYEKLSSSERDSVPVAAFQTPLGTNHKFNGFADKFLVTPDAGLEDLYLQVAWSKGAWATFVTYHDFDSDRVGLNYGDEIDAQLVYTTRWKQQFAGKAALYGADEFATDTNKIWVWTSWAF